MSRLLGAVLLCLCIALCTAEEPAQVVAEAAASDPNGPPQTPVPFDDSYTFSGVTNRPISEVLNVLANDVPQSGLRIIQIKGFSSPLYGKIAFTDSSISYQVDSYDGAEVTDYFKYTVVDRSGKTGEATVLVTVQPATPSISAAGDSFKFEWPGSPARQQRVRLDVLGNDAGSGLQLVGLKLTPSMQGVPSIAGNKRFVIYTVPSYSGATFRDTFLYEVTDAKNSTSRMARVVVNVGPSQSPVIAASDDSYTIRAAAGKTSSRSLFVLQNDTGSGDLILLDVTPATSRVQISADKQSIEYAVDYDGKPFIEVFRYRMRDETGATSSARVEVSVVTDDPAPQPVTAADDTFAFTVKAGTTGARFDLPVLNNDKGKGIFVISAISASPNFRGTLSVPADGQSIVYRLQQRFDGAAFTDTFTYVVRDGAGGSARASVDVVVSPEAPAIAPRANPDTFALSLDATGRLAPTVLDVLANDTGNAIFMARWQTSDFFGNVSWDRVNNYFVYSMPQPYGGSAFTWLIDYTIRDLNNEPSSTRATISVANSNLPPLEAADDSFSYTLTPGSSNFRMDLDVLANDAGLNKYIASYVTTSASFKGALSIAANAQYLTYRLPGQYDGSSFTDVLTYVVRDSSGASAQARVTIHITPDSSPPTSLKANPDTFRFQTDANNALQRTTLDVLANDAGGGLKITSFQTSDMYVGVLTLDRTNNRFNYGVAELTGGSRTWWFDYTVTDSSGATATARATVRVDAGQAPLPITLRDDVYNLTAAASSTLLTRLSVLANDDTSPGLKLVGYEYAAPAYGELAVNPGFLTYKLNTQGFVAGNKFTDKFRYIAADGTGQPEYKAVVSVNVVIT
ncbi:hypothetical protein OEZ85_002667 [Tetradesmus obliquus]|uniref:Cadherin domain-containing protein n=1 Tax=Tetradesmus obliquus TaxID=3088 RepID=A0ABY8U0H2_TETOB|nr:hypothetical protein OEZ85_002667 [Tetradesmus obliquus]